MEHQPAISASFQRGYRIIAPFIKLNYRLQENQTCSILMLEHSWWPNEHRLERQQSDILGLLAAVHPGLRSEVWAAGRGIGFTGPGQGFVDLNFVSMTHYSRSLQSCPISRWVTNKLHFWPYFSAFPPLRFWPKLDLICHFLFHRAAHGLSVTCHICFCSNPLERRCQKSKNQGNYLKPELLVQTLKTPAAVFFSHLM